MHRIRPASLFLTLALLLQAGALVLGKVRHYKWQVDYQFWSPDCVQKVVISINGNYPGPTIRAHVGDTIVVELENLMPTEAVLVHWHGIRQVRCCVKSIKCKPLSERWRLRFAFNDICPPQVRNAEQFLNLLLFAEGHTLV